MRKIILLSMFSLLAFVVSPNPVLAEENQVRSVQVGQIVLLKSDNYIESRAKFESMNTDSLHLAMDYRRLGVGSFALSFGEFVQPVKVLSSDENSKIRIETQDGQQKLVNMDWLILPLKSIKTKNNLLKIVRNDHLDVVSKTTQSDLRTKEFRFVSGKVLEIYGEDIVMLEVDSLDEHAKKVDFFFIHKLTRNISTREKVAKLVARRIRQAPLIISAVFEDLIGTGGYYTWLEVHSRKICEQALTVHQKERYLLLRMPRTEI